MAGSIPEQPDADHGELDIDLIRLHEGIEWSRAMSGDGGDDGDTAVEP